MKTLTALSLSASLVALVSCSNQTSNPYGAPAANQVPSTNPYAVPQSNGETGNTAPYQQLPGVGNTLPPTQPAAPNSYSPPSPSASPAPSTAYSAPAVNAPTAGSTLPYTVKPGDSLWKLSRDYDTTVEAIQAANGISGNNIRVGETIQIPNN
ncbi:LysM peptidoglycan-binding domain-containing protein [Rubritalea spongiae]|uniref:LysM peptidoglycan-binding domain-containing protein n=1 Tax=Rubritalea spongiae TaxID=430797 RepID=A0ABW5E2Y1_9BACT